jgi:hypothetical protein
VPSFDAGEAPRRSTSSLGSMAQIAHNDDIAALVQGLCDSAIAKGDFAVDPSEDHALHLQIGVAIRSLLDLGQEGHLALERLLDHSSPHVRSWVATVLLLDGHADAIPVLEFLGNGSGLTALCARTVLSEFRQGRLRSPFDPNEA